MSLPFVSDLSSAPICCWIRAHRTSTRSVAVGILRYSGAGVGLWIADQGGSALCFPARRYLVLLLTQQRTGHSKRPRGARE